MRQGKILDFFLDWFYASIMTRVTGKFQITLPKRLVDAFGIHVGDEVELVASGDRISIVPANAVHSGLTTEERLRLFDETTQRIKQAAAKKTFAPAKDRGWTREELYTRGRTR